MRAPFTRIDRLDGVRLASERRGGASAWPDDLVADLCRELPLVPVVDPFERPPLPPEAGRPTYLRRHGVTGPRHVYSDDELARLEALLPRDADGAAASYVMFNNRPRVGDARRFLRVLRSDP